MASEMAGRIRRFDWAATGLGTVENWSRTFRTALDLCLGSRMCSCIYWGKERLIIYNDAYGSILGTKHPWALGRTADEVWPEIFDVIGRLMKETLHTGKTTGADDAAIFLNCSGYVEEFYCSFSYAPLIDERGEIEGVFATLPETSVRVIGERRLRTLQRLGADAREVRRPQQTLESAAEVISENPRDIPFASMYLWGAEETQASLCATANIARGTPLSFEVLRESDETSLLRLARQSMTGGGQRGHFGLQGMRERSANMGGRFDVRPGQNGGTTIVLSVPGARAYES